MAKMKAGEIVAGYRFETTGGEDVDRNGTICQIIARGGTDSEQLDEPRFIVEFGDGYQMHVMASEVSPWFPT